MVRLSRDVRYCFSELCGRVVLPVGNEEVFPVCRSELTFEKQLLENVSTYAVSSKVGSLLGMAVAEGPVRIQIVSGSGSYRFDRGFSLLLPA